MRSVGRICFIACFTSPAGRRLQSMSAPNKPFGIETGFGESDGKSAFGAIVRALHETFTNQIANGILHLDFMCEIDVWRRTDF